MALSVERTRPRILHALAGVVACVILIFAAGAAEAQDAPAQSDIVEYEGDSSFDGYVSEKRDEYQIYVLGDTLADGLGAGLRRLLAGNTQIKVHQRTHAGTGLARPDRYNWNLAISKLIEGKNVDVAVVFIGGNDTHSVTTPEGRYTIGSDGWRKAYTAYVDEFIGHLKEHGTAVYWLELPPMWREAYDITTRMVSVIHRERVLAAGMKYLRIRNLFTDQDGKFTLMGFDSQGQFRRLRSRDGVHFLGHGNDKLASLVLKEIQKDIQIAEKGGTSDFDNTVDGTAGRPTSLNLPIFAQESESGQAIPVDLGPSISEIAGRTVDADQNASRTSSFVVSGTAQSVSFAPEVAPGSPAARVLLEGDVLEPKPGRADDFSWPSQ